MRKPGCRCHSSGTILGHKPIAIKVQGVVVVLSIPHDGLLRNTDGVARWDMRTIGEGVGFHYFSVNGDCSKRSEARQQSELFYLFWGGINLFAEAEVGQSLSENFPVAVLYVCPLHTLLRPPCGIFHHVAAVCIQNACRGCISRTRQASIILDVGYRCR